MAKKQAQFRFEETFYSDLASLAEDEGVTITEVVRDALKIYFALYQRCKKGGVRLFLEYDDPDTPRCEVVLPWTPFKSN